MTTMNIIHVSFHCPGFCCKSFSKSETQRGKAFQRNILITELELETFTWRHVSTNSQGHCYAKATAVPSVNSPEPQHPPPTENAEISDERKVPFFSSHVKAITTSAFYHLKNINKIRDYLSTPDLEKLNPCLPCSQIVRNSPLPVTPIFNERNLGKTIFEKTKDDDKMGLSIEDKMFLELMDKEMYMDDANN
ncbi:hypothetical protein NFI96_002189 [Prochilodus magdalenae]|nr:hypothetical protein NFI96_002189 [Prochilodus magdalenae]